MNDTSNKFFVLSSGVQRPSCNNGAAMNEQRKVLQVEVRTKVNNRIVELCAEGVS